MTHLFDPPTPNFPEHHDPHHVDPHHADHQQTIESGNSQIDANSVNPVDSQSVLRNPNFLSLWSGQVFSQIADKIFLVLVIAIVSTQFQHEGETISGWVSAVMVAFTIPAILFGSIAGVYVDRWKKKTVLVSSNILRGVLVLSIPLLLWVTKN
ncbi:MAG: arabinose efflux permease, partial [Pseudanabaena sp.]